jgi:hypothetical protein
MTASGWCAPGPLESKPDHDGCHWEPCDCPCHPKPKDD